MGIRLSNIYAPNQASIRAQFWDVLNENLPNTDCLCLGGDFNMWKQLKIGQTEAHLQPMELTL